MQLEPATGVSLFLSALPARGATWGDNYIVAAIDISIRAPREGSDFVAGSTSAQQSYFYPRSPRGERPIFRQAHGVVDQFLSALPARGATQPKRVSAGVVFDFYPRSPRGERRRLAESDQRLRNISIRAPREGSDGHNSNHPAGHRYFYPRSPRGERHLQLMDSAGSFEFLSALPARGAT